MPDSTLNNQTVNETRTPEMIAQGLQLVEEIKENVWLLVDPETGKQYYAKTAEPQELEMTKRAAEMQLPEDSPLVIAKPLSTGTENIPPAIAQLAQPDSSRPEFIIMEAVPKGICFANLLYPPPGKPSDLSSLDGKPITAEEYQSYIETLRVMNEQGVFHHDLASNTEIVRGEDGKLRVYAYDFEPQSFRPMYAHPHEDYAQAVDNGERMIQIGVLSPDAASMLSQHDVTERASSAASLRTAEEQHAHQSALGLQGAKTPEIPKLDPWDVPAFDVGKNPNETIFQNSERPVGDLLADAQASGQNKINRKDVPLTPERKLYHEVIVQLVTTRSFDDEHQLKAAVDAIKSSPEYERAIKSGSPQDMQKAVESMLATNEATKDLKPLDTHAAKDRQVVVMMGGSGTGKSSVRNVLVADMKERGVDPGVVIDADAFKELLGDPKKMGLEFADLTHQESSLIVDKIRGRLDDMVKTTGKAPNAIIDKTSATPAHLEDLAKTAGTVEVHCTYCPVEEAVSRAGARGEKTGRYVPTKMILEINKEVSAGVQKLLADPNVNITIYDTDVKYGEPPKVILEKAPGSNDVVIYDINKAAALINQQEINSKAKSPDQLYADSNKKPLSEIISTLAQNGQDIVIKKPGTNETIAEIRDKKLIISDEQSFRNLIGSQEADKLVHLTSEKTNLGAENDRQRQQTADSESKTVETGVAESGKERQGHGEERRPKSSSDIAGGEPHSTGNSGREVEPRQRGSAQVENVPDRVNPVSPALEPSHSPGAVHTQNQLDLNVRNTRGSIALNLQQTAQSSINIAQIISNPDFNYSARDMAMLGINAANVGMGVGGTAVDVITLYKPSSALGAKFGGVTSIIGAGISGYELVDNISRAAHSEAPLTWKNEGRDIMMSAANFTVSSVGAVGSTMVWLGAEGGTVAATGSTMIGLSAASGGALALGAGAKMLIEGYSDNALERSAIYEQLHSNTVSSVGSSQINQQLYADIPGLKPRVEEYSKLNTFVNELERKKLTYSNGQPMDFRALLNNPEDLGRVTTALSSNYRDYAEQIRKAEFDGFITRETITSTGLGGYVALPIANFISGRDIGKEIDTSREQMVDATRVATLGSYAGSAISGDLGDGVRNYKDRYADYERMIKPLEREYPEQIKQLEKLREIKIAINHPAEQAVTRAEILGADSSFASKYYAAVAPADNADNARRAEANQLAQTKDVEGIRKFLGATDEQWNAIGSSGRSLGDVVNEYTRNGQIGTFLQNHVTNTSAAKQVAAEQLAKVTFADEMKKVEAMSPDQRAAYFAKNADFIERAGLSERRDLALVGLSTSEMDYMAKKMEFSPTTLADQARKETIENQANLEALKQENTRATSYLKGAEEGSQMLGKQELKDIQVKGADGSIISFSEFQQKQMEIITKQQEVIAKLKEQAATNADPDLAAKIAIKEATLSTLQVQYENANLQNTQQKLAQYEAIKQGYAQETTALLAKANENGGEIKADEKTQETMAAAQHTLKTSVTQFNQLQERQKAGEAIPMQELQKAEAEMLVSQRNLVQVISDASVAQRLAPETAVTAATPADTQQPKAPESQTYSVAVVKLDKDGDGKLSAAELNLDKSGASANVLDQGDWNKIKDIMGINGNKEAADDFAKLLADKGIKFDGSVAVNTAPAQTPVGETKNAQLAAR